ncbi:MAG: hypothetical protein JWN70_6625 [Planctomycetaceae bacterium]|nr:hypothetical protein [Planctomycetaceae bacterium]
MRIAGKRLKRTRLVRTPRYIIEVDVEAVIPEDDPSEECYEAETVELLKEVQEHAEQNDVAWLKQHGRVYKALEEAA